jgi:hypothetical protein
MPAMTHVPPSFGSPRDGAASSRDTVSRCGGQTLRRRRSVRVPALLVAALWVGAAAAALAQETEEESAFSFGAELEVTSRYVWRGLEASDGTVAEPLIWASAGNFTLSGWGNVPLTAGANRGSFDEADVTLGYSTTWGKLKIEPAACWFHYRNQPDAPDTGELSLTLTYPAGPVELFLEHDLDIAEYSGAYFDVLGATWTGKKSSGGVTPAVQLAVALGSAKFNEAYVGPASAAVNFVMADFGVTYETKGAFYARVHVCALATVAGTIRNELPSGDLVFGGVVLGVGF